MPGPKHDAAHGHISSPFTERHRPGQLFLDCDGVLADFESAAEQVFDMPTAQARQHLGLRQFWDTLHRQPDFYGSLPLLPDARILFDAVDHLRPMILTGCPLGGWAEEQKRRWAAKHFPGTPIITCMAREKSLYMQPGDLLVDDLVRNRDLWEEAGGIFLHHTSAASTLDALRELGHI